MNIAELQTTQKIERLTLHQKHIKEMESLKQKQREEMDKLLSASKKK